MILQNHSVSLEKAVILGAISKTRNFTFFSYHVNLSTHNYMAITSSAKKAFRSAKKKRVFNLRTKSSIESQLKDFRRLIASKNKAEATKLIPLLYKALDKAAKTNFIKNNTASRLKSRAALALVKISK